MASDETKRVGGSQVDGAFRQLGHISHRMTHNYALLRHGDEYLFIGGRHRMPTRHDNGAWHACAHAPGDGHCDGH
jgi:hypothetical protein